MRLNNTHISEKISLTNIDNRVVLKKNTLILLLLVFIIQSKDHDIV